MKPPKAGSRKAVVYDVFNASGLEAAIKKAVELGLAAGTTKSWASAWARGGSGNSTAPGREAPMRQSKSRTPDNGIRFDHVTRGAAVQHLHGIMRRSGVSQAAFHILEQEGKFAVVPAHQVPNVKIPQFEDGDWVCDTIIPDTLGRIVAAGPQQCEVRYEKPRPGYMTNTTYVPNVYLVKMPVPEKKVRDRIEGIPAKKARVKIETPKKGKTNAKKKTK